MTVEILTPEKKLFSGEAYGVQLPGTTGLFEILDKHAPLVSALGKGTIKILKDKRLPFQSTSTISSVPSFSRDTHTQCSPAVRCQKSSFSINGQLLVAPHVGKITFSGKQHNN